MTKNQLNMYKYLLWWFIYNTDMYPCEPVNTKTPLFPRTSWLSVPQVDLWPFQSRSFWHTEVISDFPGREVRYFLDKQIYCQLSCDVFSTIIHHSRILFPCINLSKQFFFYAVFNYMIIWGMKPSWVLQTDGVWRGLLKKLCLLFCSVKFGSSAPSSEANNCSMRVSRTDI